MPWHLYQQTHIYKNMPQRQPAVTGSKAGVPNVAVVPKDTEADL